MEPVPSFGEYAPMQSFLESIAEDCSQITTSHISRESPPHPLRSHSRKQRSIDISRRAAQLEKSAFSNTSYTPPRLRRTPAFSDLGKSGSPSFAPVVSVSVAKDCWLEESVAKAKSILFDKEIAEQMAHRARTIRSIEYLSTIAEDGDMGEQAKKLHHKGKSQDLRSDYSSDDAKAWYGSPGSQLLSLSEGQDSSSSADDISSNNTVSSSTINSDTGGAIPTQQQLYCICRRTSGSTSEETVPCHACGDLVHAGCAFPSYRSANLEKNVFYCPGWVAVAFRIIAEEQEHEQDARCKAD